MASSFTYTTTFTETQARYLASKVASDLRQLLLIYGLPPEDKIDAYVEELTILLPGGYVKSIDYGFVVDGAWVVALRYAISPDGTVSADDRAGRVPTNASVQQGSWRSYLRYSGAWERLTPERRAEIEETLPFRREEAPEPGSSGGAWVQDKTYSMDGKGVQREVFRR